MGKEIMPINLSNEITLTSLEKENLDEKRNSLLKELRCITGLPELVASLDQNTLYKLVLVPEGAKLHTDELGNLKGVFYKDGKIVQHAKFREVKPSLFKAVKVVGSQVLLVSIAMQLNRIEKQVDKIFKELHGDRIAEINTGHFLFEQACKVENLEHRNHLVLNAITELTRGFEKTVSALQRQIKELPVQELTFFDNWVNDKSKDAKDRHEIAFESFTGCIKALQTLARCYLLLDETDSSLDVVRECLSRINDAGVSIAYSRSRLAPKINGVFPEVGWRDFIEFKKQLDESASPHFINLPQGIELEIKPSELLELTNGKL